MTAQAADAEHVMRVACELASFTAYPPPENLYKGLCYLCPGIVHPGQGVFAIGRNGNADGSYGRPLHLECARLVGEAQEQERQP